MLCMCLGQGSDAGSAAWQVAAVKRVAVSYRRLQDEAGGRVSTKSDSDACGCFLEELEAASKTMHINKAPRCYRAAFTVNYRALFPSQARSYRVDVLEASFEQYAVIWVNGDKFQFSTEAMQRAEALQAAWYALGALLERWDQASELSLLPAFFSRPGVSELRGALAALDYAWASFEHKYIAELIAIEAQARRFLVQAIECEHRVQVIGAECSDVDDPRDVPDFQDEQRHLVECIARLNSVANVRRKGRDDLTADILFDATATLRRCREAEISSDRAEVLGAARILATDVVESFASMREYLREVELCPERVDPHLGNNPGLVARLVDWEESWELGARYMQNGGLLGAVCNLVAEISAAQRLAPDLATMCSERDVEFFLVLPRIMFLCFAAEPSRHVELLRDLLPYRFPDLLEGSGAEPEHAWDEGLEGFLGKFRRTKELLMESQPADAGGALFTDATAGFAWEVLVKRAVGGAGTTAPCDCSAPSLGCEAQAAIEDLMHDLEPLSMELQRNCPEDWNQCTAILVQCLTEGDGKRKQVPFCV